MHLDLVDHVMGCLDRVCETDRFDVADCVLPEHAALASARLVAHIPGALPGRTDIEPQSRYAFDPVARALSADRFCRQDLAVILLECWHENNSLLGTHRAHTKTLLGVFGGDASRETTCQLWQYFQCVEHHSASHAGTCKNLIEGNRTAEVRGSIPLGSTNPMIWRHVCGCLQM